MSTVEERRQRRKDQRRKEIEEKRKRLKALQEKNKQSTSAVPDSTEVDLSSVENVEDLLSRLDRSALLPDKPPSSPSADTPDSGARRDEAQKNDVAVTEASASSVATPEISPSRVFTSQLNVTVHNIPPKEVEVYSKGVQTEDSWLLKQAESEGEEELDTSDPTEAPPPSDASDLLHEGGSSKGKEPAGGESQNEELEPVALEMDEERARAVIKSSAFADFFERAAKSVERALYVSDQFKVSVDYTTDEDSTKDSAMEGLSLKGEYFDDRWSKYRSVTDIAWSSKHPELLACSYSANEAASHDPDGVVCVWNTQYSGEKPEFVFTTESPVMSLLCPRYHPTCIVGATYSGQLVLWDTRAHSTPVQRTPLSALGHTHPVYDLSLVGTANANSVVSVSTDGRLCVWSLDSLVQPVEVLELRNKKGKSYAASGAKNVAATAMAFPAGEVNELVVGSEEGALYQAFRHGTKNGVQQRFDGHTGPATALSFNQAQGSVDFSRLFISSSLDWSAKLWHTSYPSPLLSFDSFESVYDIAWSPINPAMFALVDGAGHLDLWDLSADIDAPIERSQHSKHAVNRVSWSASGRHIASGDSTGRVFLHEVGEVGISRPETWVKMEEVVDDLMRSSRVMAAVSEVDAMS